MTQNTLQARSCAKGEAQPPLVTPGVCQGVATVRISVSVAPPLQNPKKRRRPAHLTGRSTPHLYSASGAGREKACWGKPSGTNTCSVRPPRTGANSNGTLHNVPLPSLLEDIKMTSAELKHRAKPQEWSARIQDCQSIRFFVMGRNARWCTGQCRDLQPD